MKFFKLKDDILHYHLASNTFIKTDDDLTNQEIVVVFKGIEPRKTLFEESTETLKTTDYREIEPEVYWSAYDYHFHKIPVLN